MDDEKLAYVRMLADLSRRDIYARRVDTRYVPVHEKLTQLILERHLEGGPAIGQYILSGDKTQVAVIDMDSHDGAMSWPEIVAVALKIISAGYRLGLRAHVFRSGGGHGIHLWFLWDNPQNARYVRHMVRNLIASVGLKDGTGGVATGEVEVFPKQDRVAPGKVGNLIALPGARESIVLDRETLDPVEWATTDFPEVTMRLSSPVPEVAEEETVPASFVRLPGDAEEVRAALKRVSADAYDTWLRVALALKHGFGDDGFLIFSEWSATCTEKYREQEAARFWAGLKPNGSIGLGTIFHLAKSHGWNGPAHPVIREMNARFGILAIGNAIQIILKNGDRRPDDEFATLSKNVFFDRLIGETIPSDSEGGSDRQSKAKYWFSHRLADRYHRLDFDPGMPPGHNGYTWNTWTGFGIEPVAGDWSLLKHHILTNICRGDDRLYKWLLNWMAMGLQRPGEVIGTAPVLIGMPGTGKGILAHAYGRLWGRHYVTVTHPEHVVGRFSGHLMGIRFVFVDEGTFGGSKKDAGLLKTRITEPKLMFERKGIDPITMTNRLLFMVASNEASVVHADKNDRRWMVLDVGDEHRGDHSYFGAVAQQLEHGGYEAMLHELLARDLSDGPDPRKVIHTEALFEQMRLAQGPEIAYLHMILENGRLPQNWLEGPAITTIRALHEEMRSRFPLSGRNGEISLGKLMAKTFPNVRKQANGRYFVKKSEDGKLMLERSTRYLFPPLSHARRTFERHVGMATTWNENVDEWECDPDPDGSDPSDDSII